MNKAAGGVCLFVWMAAACAVADPVFMSMKQDKVNLRTGPGERFPITWVYTEKTYPVEVIDAFELWRQVREADGTIGWVHKIMLSPARYALILEEDKLLKSPQADGKTAAIVQRGTTGRILTCPADAPAHCQLQFRQNGKKIKGWFPRKALWGVRPDEIIE
ncbi:MAG: SH3 domain-containing protein [Alphaproteobacteria bacterium]|nr:SH3 domain-containing protein [Alphaproteobacteria bacterium]